MVEIEPLRAWIGRTEAHDDVASAPPLALLAATLDRDAPPPKPGDAVPPLGHWLYFLPVARQSELGDDGHPKRGGFLPPVPLPRRMFAGARIEFARPLRVGEPIRRVATIRDVALKEGKSGPLVFVVVRHEVSGERGVAVVEVQDIVYRGETPAGVGEPGPRPAPAPAAWQRTVRPDPVLLFRFSALTFNGHRIHYDHPYATGHDGYPGLVVHGPLSAALLVDLCRRARPESEIAEFSFRAVRPIFATRPFVVAGRPAEDRASARLWAVDADGALAMEASVRFRA